MSLLISCKVLCYLIFVISMYASGKCTYSTPPLTEATPLSSPTTKYRISYVPSFTLNPKAFRFPYYFSVFNSKFSIIPTALPFPFLPLFFCCNTFWLARQIIYFSCVLALTLFQCWPILPPLLSSPSHSLTLYGSVNRLSGVC